LAEPSIIVESSPNDGLAADPRLEELNKILSGANRSNPRPRTAVCLTVNDREQPGKAPDPERWSLMPELAAHLSVYAS